MARARYWTLALALSFCLAIVAAFFFSYRAGRTARHMHWRNESVAPWMSVPFVAHTHHMHADVLFQAIHVAPGAHDRRPIREIARSENVPVADLIRQLRQAIDANRGQGDTVPPPAKAP